MYNYLGETVTGLTDYFQKPFDALYSITTDETTQDVVYADLQLEDGVYVDTQSEEGLYSITSTQSGESTYSAYDADDVEQASRSDPTVSDREDPRTRSDSHPTAADD